VRRQGAINIATDRNGRGRSRHEHHHREPFTRLADGDEARLASDDGDRARDRGAKILGSAIDLRRMPKPARPSRNQSAIDQLAAQTAAIDPRLCRLHIFCTCISPGGARGCCADAQQRNVMVRRGQNTRAHTSDPSV
jgi:hypothetical protein